MTDFLFSDLPKPTTAADPVALAVSPDLVPQMTASTGRRMWLGSGQHGAHIRAEGLDFRECPSRRGDKLYYRDGRVVPV